MEAKLRNAVKDSRRGRLTVNIYLTKGSNESNVFSTRVGEISGYKEFVSNYDSHDWDNGTTEIKNLQNQFNLENQLNNSYHNDRFGMIVELCYKSPNGAGGFLMENVELEVTYQPIL